MTETNLPKINVIPGTRFYKPPVGLPTNYSQWTVEQRASLTPDTVLPLPRLDDITVGDIVIVHSRSGWWVAATVTSVDKEDRNGVAEAGKTTFFLHYYDEYGWLMVGSGNLDALKKLSITREKR